MLWKTVVMENRQEMALNLHLQSHLDRFYILNKETCVIDLAKDK